jgi:hypothetical protein
MLSRPCLLGRLAAGGISAATIHHSTTGRPVENDLAAISDPLEVFVAGSM